MRTLRQAPNTRAGRIVWLLEDGGLMPCEPGEMTNNQREDGHDQDH